MPQGLQEAACACPYCGEPISLLIDGSVAQQRYVEDCFVCCRPIVVEVAFEASGELSLQLHQEDD